MLPDADQVVIRSIVERQAAADPRSVCVVFEGETWTWKQALTEGYRAANALRRRGVGPGDHVLIMLENGPAWLRAWWGVNFLGATVVPVNIAYRGEILRHLCRDSEAALMIATPDLAGRLRGCDDAAPPIIGPGELSRGRSDPPALAEPLEPWDLCAINYTSGTTGPSKGVLTTYLQAWSTPFPFTVRMQPGDRLLSVLPMFHISGFDVPLAFWSAGASVAIRRSFEGRRYFRIAREVGATVGCLAGTMPAFLASQAPNPDDRDHRLRYLLTAPVPPDPTLFLARFGIDEIFNCFAMTEVPTPMFTSGPITDPSSCGRARPGFDVRVVDEHDLPVPPGTVGELIVRSDRPWEITLGYWRQPESTVRAWRNGWFHTGDAVMMDPNGEYHFVDRKNDTIRRRGENISSFEVEREIAAHPAVARAACVAVPAPLSEDEILAVVVCTEGETVEPRQLIEFLIGRLPYFMVPRYIEVVSELPMTPTQKVRKVELRDRGVGSSTWDREAEGIVLTRADEMRAGEPR